MSKNIAIEIVTADVLNFEADVLALKFARDLYGADLVVHDKLASSGKEVHLPEIGDVAWHSSNECLKTEKVLFVGVKPLNQFRYGEIREFASKVLNTLTDEKPETRHVALTLHGPGYGLDEIEAFKSELAGLLDAVNSGNYPPSLEVISFVERNSQRTERLQVVLDSLFPDGLILTNKQRSTAGRKRRVDKELQSVGRSSAEKPHVFLAMPFATTMQDVFDYGIQPPVKKAKFLCERADYAFFTGDVIQWVRERITSAALVIAELTDQNPNVYLEVGYAWGKNIPTVLLVRDSADHLKFDVRGQRCLIYTTIKELEKKLLRELQGVTANKDSRSPRYVHRSTSSL